MIRSIILFGMLLVTLDLTAQLEIDTSYTTRELVKEFFVDTSKGVSISEVHYTGAYCAIGAFNTKLQYNDLFKKGIILSSGSVFNAIGPNEDISASAYNKMPGYFLLEELAEGKSFDASVLSFKFVPLTDAITFNFIFASEEYPEYVNKNVNDVFGFFIKDLTTGNIENIAVLPDNGDPITVDFVNAETNSSYYISVPPWDKSNIMKWDKDRKNGEMALTFQFDGLTTPITIGTELTPYNKYEFIVAIADIGDQVYDSWVMLEANSFVSNGNLVNPEPDDLISILKERSGLKKLKYLQEEDQVKVMTDISFELNSHKIGEDSYAMLDEIISVMNYSELMLEVNGYTDDTGTDEYNLDLSQKRADSVKDYLVVHGISSDRILAVGKGELKNNTKQNLDESRSKNRKVEFVFKSGD